MSRRKYPRLTPAEVMAILVARGFSLLRTTSSHRHYGAIIHGKSRLVTVDTKYARFGVKLMKSMVWQSGLTRDEFYSATKATAKMAGLQRV